MVAEAFRVRAAAAACAAAVLFAGLAQAARIGEAESVVPAASFSRGQVVRVLNIKDSLEQNDRIVTTGDGATQVRFLDDTMLTIGPNSEVVLDRFVFDGSRVEGLSVELVRGAMRFVSGRSNRSAYEIRTSVATLGVRGTVVDIGGGDRSVFNFVDGSGDVCRLSSGVCRTVNFGQSFGVNQDGFFTPTPQELAALQQSLDVAHYSLALAAGRDPSAAQGAAGGDKKSPGDQQSNYVPPPTDIQTQEPIQFGLGPAFPSSVQILRVAGAGGDNINSTTLHAEKDILSAARIAALWDFGTNALRSITLAATDNPIDDPNPTNFTRHSARLMEEFVGIGNVPGVGQAALYYMGRVTDGQLLVTQSSVSELVPFTANQGLHMLLWWHTGGLGEFPVNFGTRAIYDLEAATRPTWSDGRSAPGTFAGQLAVAFGSTSIFFGLEASVAMNEGTFSFQTQGGIANPVESGAFAPLNGNFSAMANNLPVIYTGNQTIPPENEPLCSSNCHAEVHFFSLFTNKVGLTYHVITDFPDGPEIHGVASFGAPNSDQFGGTTTVAAYVDTYTNVLATGAATGIVEAQGVLTTLKEIDLGTVEEIETHRKRTTAQPVDVGGVPGFITWERWTNGDFQRPGYETPVTTTIPENGGLHLVHGVPMLSNPVAATSVMYSLLGGTKPTLGDGSVAPGTINDQTSKVGVTFTGESIYVGADINVSIGGGQFHLFTDGGANDPSLAVNGGTFLATYLGVNVTQSSASIPCTSESCFASMAGFLSGYEGALVGLTYSFGDSSSNLVSGAAGFVRDMPFAQFVGYAFAIPASLDPIRPAFSGSQLNSGNVNLVGTGQDTATGLALDFLNVHPPGGDFQNFSRQNLPYPASVADQGTIPGILSWERWTDGEIVDQNSNSYVLSANQGLHTIHGIRATNVPTTGTAMYDLAGGTKPTVANGSVAPGTLTSGQLGVNFTSAAPKFGVNLNVGIDGGNLNVLSAGGAANPSLAAPMLHTHGTFGASGIGVAKSGPTTLCTTACTATVNGALFGPGASHLGIVYQIGNADAAKTISGAAGFAKAAP
jgi:hypothetical protein